MIKAIETNYKGYRFRSRLEARWAIFFDAAGMKWEYETQGFHLKSGLYLPDFYLPEYESWAEVKPFKFNDVEMRLCNELLLMTGNPVLLLDGTPSIQSYTLLMFYETDEGDQVEIDLEMSALEKRWWYTFDWTYDHNNHDVFDQKYRSHFMAYVKAARSARFEHGERHE